MLKQRLDPEKSHSSNFRAFDYNEWVSTVLVTNSWCRYS